MGKIRQLDQHVANLIAAGEVIERASSVVKELVENSIDAEATLINISLTGSGLKEIVVSDNGCGMDKSDVKMAFLPHATSKIFDPNDLFNIKKIQAVLDYHNPVFLHRQVYRCYYRLGPCRR